MLEVFSVLWDFEMQNPLYEAFGWLITGASLGGPGVVVRSLEGSRIVVMGLEGSRIVAKNLGESRRARKSLSRSHFNLSKFLGWKFLQSASLDVTHRHSTPCKHFNRLQILGSKNIWPNSNRDTGLLEILNFRIPTHRWIRLAFLSCELVHRQIAAVLSDARRRGQNSEKVGECRQ